VCYGAVALAIGLLRVLAVPGVYHIGTNLWWWRRALLYYLGRFGSYLQPRGWHIPAILAVVGTSVWVSRRGFAWSMAVLASGVGIVLLLYSVQSGLPLIVGVTVCLVELPKFATLSVWMAGAYLALRFSRQEVVLGVAVAVLGSAPTFLATQTLDYTRWLGGFGHSILAWAAIRGAWQAAPLAWRGLREGFGFQVPEEGAETGPEDEPATNRET
jgi:hypothetical protein